MISNEALPDPTIIAARSAVKEYFSLLKQSSTALRELKCLDNLLSLTIPVKNITCSQLVSSKAFLKLIADNFCFL